MELAFWTLATNPVNLFVAPTTDLVRIKANCSIPSKVKLSHDRVVAVSQTGLFGSDGTMH